MNHIYQQVREVKVKIIRLQHPLPMHISKCRRQGSKQNVCNIHNTMNHTHPQVRVVRVKVKCLQHPKCYEPCISASTSAPQNSLRCEQVHPLPQFSQLRRSTSTAPVHSAVNKYSSCPSSLSCEKVTPVLSAVIRYICCPSSLGCKKVHLLPQFAQLRKSTSAPPVHSAVKKLPQFSQLW